MKIARVGLLIALCQLLARPVSAAPGAASLVAPSGEVVGTTIAFSWHSVPTTTWYLFWLEKGTSPGFVMQQWYTAEQAGCANGGTCTITLTPAINGGSHIWYIQTWSTAGTGPWSIGNLFVVKDPMPNWSSKLPDARRFTLVFDGEAVLDHESGLTWERTPRAQASAWADSVTSCSLRVVASRKGWRAPTLAELHTLLDMSRNNPALPSGHPFTLGDGRYFWSQTSSVQDPTYKMYVILDTGQTGTILATNVGLRPLCVRSPATAPY